MPLIIAQIMVILVLIGTNFKIKMLHERIFLNLVLLLLLKSQLIKIISFVCTNRINLLNLKRRSNRLATVENGSLLMLIKQQHIISTKPSSRDCCRIANSILKKGKSATLPLFNCPTVLSSASVKAKSFTGDFSKNSNLKHSNVYLPAFPSQTNLKLQNTYQVQSWLKVLTNLDSSKALDPYSYSSGGLRKCKAELSDILFEFFNMRLKESFFSRLLEGLMCCPCI